MKRDTLLRADVKSQQMQSASRWSGTAGKYIVSNRIITISAVALLIISTANVVFASSKMAVEGFFTIVVDISTLTLTPAGSYCRLNADEVELVFSGTLDGVTNGITRALVLAPCEDVGAIPLGTFKDVFQSKLEFMGV